MSIRAIRAGGPRLTAGSDVRVGALGSVGVAVGVAGLAAGLTWFCVRSGSLVAVAAMLVVAGSLWFAGTRKPGFALALLMLYLGLLDGYLKLATGSSGITLVRDAMLYALALGQLLRLAVHHRETRLPPLSRWVLAFVVLVGVEMLNPLNGTIAHTLAGARQNLEFVPLFFLAYSFVRTKRSLRWFVVILAVIGALNGAVTYAQSRLTPQQLAAWGKGYAQRVEGTQAFSLGGRTFYDTSGNQHTRPFGLMSDAGTGGLVAALSLGAVAALAASRRRRFLVLAVVGAPACVAGVVTSQGRAAVVGSLVVVGMYGAMTATGRRRLTTLFSILAIAGIGYVLGSALLSGTANRYSGLTTSQFLSTTEQARGKAFKAIPHNLTHYPLGSGLGTGGPASGQPGAPAAAEFANAENEISYATLETGIPGMLVILGFTVLLVVAGLRGVRREPDPETRLLLGAALAPVGAMLAIDWVSPISPTTPGGPYLWAAGGLIAYWLYSRRPADSNLLEPPGSPFHVGRAVLR